MSKFFLVPSKYIKRAIYLLILLWLFGFNLLFLWLLIVFSLVFFMFRKKSVDLASKRSINKNIIASPVNGKFIGFDNNENSKILKFRVYPWHNYGLYLPIEGEILGSIDHSKPGLEQEKSNFTLLKSKLGKEIKIYYDSFLHLLSPRVFIKEGDRGIVGGLYGYLPFGGEVIVELPAECEILIKKGDNVISTQTLLASFKES